MTDSLIPRATALNGTPILVADTIPNPGQSMMRGADSLTDDSAGNAYLIFDSPPYISSFPSSISPTVAVLAKITPSGTVTKVQLVGPSSSSPLLLTAKSIWSSLARIHDDVLYVFMLVVMPDDSKKYLAAKCTDLANIGSASCWTKLDGSAGVDLLPFEDLFDFGMDIDDSGKVYIAGATSISTPTLKVRTFTPGVGWSSFQSVGDFGTRSVAADIEVDDDTGIVHVVAGNDAFCCTGLNSIYARGSSPGAIPSGLIAVTRLPFFGFFLNQGGLATFPGNKVLVLGSSGDFINWNFFDGTTWVYGTSPSATSGTASGTFAPFGSTGNVDNAVHGALSKAPDGKGRAFTMILEGGQNKYQLRTFDPDTGSWSAPTTIYTTPAPVNFSVRPFSATHLDPNPNSCNQWYAWFDPHLGKLFADFEGSGSCNTPPVAIAQNVTVSADDNCQASASVDNGSFDPDGDPITLTQSPPGPYSLGTTSVTLTVEDSKGASDTATATVTIMDDSPPMITAPPDIMVIANTAGGYSGSIGTATASDNCDSSPTISSNAPIVFPLGDTTVTWTATDDSGNSASADQVVTVKPLPVQIDIKPGSDPNCFNNDGHGAIPAAILGSATLDVNNIDPGSVMLDGLAVKATGKSDKLLAHIEDVNGDGFNDLVVQIQDVDSAFSPGTTMATLTGKLFNGIPFEGTDSICITQ